MSEKNPSPPTDPKAKALDKDETPDETFFDIASVKEIIVLWWADLRVAASFLTRLPLKADKKMEKGALSASMRAFPFVGVAIGVAGGIVLWLAVALGLPMMAAALLAVTATVALTGGMHEDGLADVADGFGGGENKSARLAIMRDSRIGAFGVLALILSVVLRAAALAAFAEPGKAVVALIAAASASRAALPVMAYRMKPARRSGLAVMAGTPSQACVYAAVALAIAITLLFLGPVAGLFALLAGCVAVFALAALSQRLIKGYTGDVMGAAQQVCEIAVLLAASAAL